MAINIELDQEQESVETSTTTQLPSHYYFYLLSFIGSLILIFLQSHQAPAVTTSHGWYTQPYIAPVFGLSIISLFSGVYLLINTRKHFTYLKDINPIELTFYAISKYRTAIIISVFFFLYIQSLSVIGFALSSFIMIISMLWISNLFNRFWVTMAFLSVVVLVIVFRVTVNVWLPDVWIYNFLPDSLSEFANMYL